MAWQNSLHIAQIIQMPHFIIVLSFYVTLYLLDLIYRKYATFLAVWTEGTSSGNGFFLTARLK